MPFLDIKLVPGVNTQVTKSQNQAGVSVSNLVRFKEGLVQKLGGWSAYYPYQISTAPIRDVHAFQSLRNQQKFVGVGALDKLIVISCGTLTDVTPQYTDNNFTPSFSVSSGSNTVTITDPNSSASVFGAVRFDTPVAVSNLLLNGSYNIIAVLDDDTYEITASSPAATTVSSGGVLPQFYCSSGTALIDVVLPNNGFQQVTGLFYPFTAPTSVGGITIQGPYQVTSIVDSTHFQIGSPTLTTSAVPSSTPVTMNGGNAAIHHYITIGPTPQFDPYGENLYGAGLYGIGIPPSQGTGNRYIATDYILDNWGETLLAFPKNGPVYTWSPDLGLQNAQAVVGNGAPQYNLGGFVGQPQEIIFVFGSCTITGQQDPLTIRWCDSGAQAGYTNWLINSQSFAGTFRIPTGSTLIGGVQAPTYAVFWTDVDVWVAQYIGQPLVYSFIRMGTGCGMIGPHAADVQSGLIYWAGISNFYMLGPNGVQVLPCAVWDFFFQQLDTANQSKVRCASNSMFNELTWYFPVLPGLGGTGENTAYVKVHIEGNEYEWDYGYLSRTAWVDVTAVGNPIGADGNGFLQQHETSFDANGGVLNAAIETGFFEIGDGSDFVFVDWVLPDAKWSALGGNHSLNFFGISPTPVTTNVFIGTNAGAFSAGAEAKQTWIATDNFTVQAVTFLMSSVSGGNPTDSIIVNLWLGNVSGEVPAPHVGETIGPNGTLLATSAPVLGNTLVAFNSITNPYTTVTFNFPSPVQLFAGTAYTFEIFRTGQLTSSAPYAIYQSLSVQPSVVFPAPMVLQPNGWNFAFPGNPLIFSLGLVKITTLLFTFYVSDYPGQPERIYGPFPVTQFNPYINCRMRGRFWRFRVENQDTLSFWRLGQLKVRYAPSGRR